MRTICKTADLICQYEYSVNEYLVRPIMYKTNKERDDLTYYTDDKQDAIDSMEKMQERYNMFNKAFTPQ